MGLQGATRFESKSKAIVLPLFLLLLITAVLRISVDADEWSPAGSMIAPRVNHTATRLPNGRVLIAGGSNGSSSLASAELYIPDTTNWSSVPLMSATRSQHTATLLANGKVLIAGGTSNGLPAGALSSTEIYDPATNNWSAAAGMNTARFAFTATLLADGKVLVAGGSNASGALSSAEIYNPGNDSWTVIPALTTQRSFHTASLLANGHVLIAGGSAANIALSTSEIYITESGSWTAAASMSSARASHAATSLLNGTVLVTGGSNGNSSLSSSEIYNPDLDSWSAITVPAMSATRAGHLATRLSDGRTLVSGGISNEDGGVPTAAAEIYDPSSNSWIAVPNMNAARSSHAGTLLSTGQVFLTGGFNSALTALNSAESLTVQQSQTITFNPLPDVGAGSPAFQVSATASSGLPVSFAASGNCSVSGSTVTPLQAGNCTITASQAGNAFWKAATPVPRSFAIVAAPIITQITPASAAVGSAVTISGNNFGATQGSSVVRFNGVSATSISSWSATSIVAVIPAGATTGNVVVTTLLSSNGVPFTVVATLAITTSSLPGGTLGTAYSQTAGATGGTTPYTWSVSTGSLPAGLSLNTSTGSITGTPSAIGTSNFTLRVADAGTQTATQALSIAVSPPPLVIATTSLPGGMAGTAYSQTAAATGGTTPYTWSISVGTLPAGLSLNTNTGAITGTPSTAGTSNFTLRVTDAGSLIAVKALSIAVSPAPLVITTSTLPGGTAGTAYSQTAAATGGTTPYTWSISNGTLPAGLSLNTSTGAITGTPLAAGTSNFILRVADAGSQTATQPLSIAVSPAPLSITTTSLPGAMVSTAYSQTAAAAGGTTPYSWSISNGTLPAGLSLNTSTGAITGTPSVTGISNFTLRVADAGSQVATRALSIEVFPISLVITTTSLPGGTVATSYSQSAAAIGGTIPYTWSISTGTLPAGLILNSSTGAITGTPTAAGTSNFTLRVADSGSQSTTKILSLAIAPAMPRITSLSPQSGAVGTTVTITGINFGAAQGTSSVTFNGAAATSITSWSGSSIVVEVPAAATTGDVVVTATLASNGVPFTVNFIGAANVLTYHNDNVRTGQRLNETILTTDNVNDTMFGKLFSYPVDGYVFGQPLYVSSVPIAGLGKRNIVLVATQHDSVYAFDADDPAQGQLWRVSFLDPQNGITSVAASDVGSNDIAEEIGITSTPVIDGDTGTIYLIAKTKEVRVNGTHFVQRLHALDIRTGAEKFGAPSTIADTIRNANGSFVFVSGPSVAGTGDDSKNGTVTFNAFRQLNRPALLLSGGIVYSAWGSHGDVPPYHGWILGHDAHSLALIYAFNTTPNGSAAGIWMSGGGPAADSSGNIYVATGNGTFALPGDPKGPQHGDSLLKLAPAPDLHVADSFTPWNQAALDAADLDLGSGGVMLLPDEQGSPRLMVIGGKTGALYLVDRDHLGGYQGCGPQCDSVMQVVPLGTSHGVFDTPAYFNNRLYYHACCGDFLKAFQVGNNSMSTEPVMQSLIPFAYPGSVPSISANGDSNGIVWLLERRSGSGVLHAYEAENLSRELFSSDNLAPNGLDGPVKFTVPTIANGKVYVGTQGRVTVFGLYPTGNITSVNVALAANGGVASASTTFSNDYLPAATINGDRKGLNWGNGGGWNDASDSSYPDWLQVDFNGIKSIQEIDVFTVQDNYAAPGDPTAEMTFSLYGVTDFNVQFWDGFNWQDVPDGVVTGNHRVWRQFIFSPISTNRIRVLVNGAPGYSRITEVEAYNVSAGGTGNIHPTVSLISPASTDTFNAPATVMLSANANDTDGTISSVDFYSGSLKIATSTSTSNPYTATWNNVVAGSYSVTAIATDNSGASTTSSAVGITVTGTSPLNVALAVNGGVATASSTINGNYSPAGTINGDRKGLNWANGGGWNDGTESNYPDWLQVDFNGTKSIQEIDVFTVQDNYSAPSDPTAGMTFSLYGLTDFNVQYWNGSSWQNVPGGAVTGNNRIWRQFIFSPISTNRIRILINGAPGYSRVTELEAYSSNTPINIPPTVSVLTPANGAAYSAPATVALSATANDSDGTISSVDFYVGSLKIATSASTASPYTATWNNVAAGNYSITAVATDNSGATTTSSSVGINVSGAITSVNVALPANGGVATASSTFSANYSPAGTINGDRRGLNWGSSGGWNDESESSYPDWLQVDFNGTKSIQEIDVFTVQDNYSAPNDPTAAMTFSLYGLIDFNVQYWNGSGWQNIPGGAVTGNNRVWRQFIFSPISTNRIRVLVTAAHGYSRVTEVEAYSSSTPANVPPTVTLTSPANTDTFSAPATVALSANANDTDGTISSVDFYVGSLKIATSASTSNPYTATWNNVAAGSYLITAVATDNSGAGTTSSPVGISVTGIGPINVALLSNGGVATSSSTYSNNYSPAGAINGDRRGLNWGSGGGWNDDTESSYPDWLQVDFNGTKLIQEIDVFTVQDNYPAPGDPTAVMTFSLYGLTDFNVQYWNGTMWQDVPGGAVTSNNRVWRQFIFSPISTSRIRIFVNGARGYSRITEVEAYASP